MGEKFWVWMKFFIHGLYSAILVCVVRWVSIIFPLDLIGICKHDILYNKKKKKAKCIILFWVWSESTVYSLVKQPCGKQILKSWNLLFFVYVIIQDCGTNVQVPCGQDLYSVVIFFLSLFESFYLDLFPSSSQDIEPDVFFKYCILGRKEKLKQFTSKHRNLISINEKYKGSTALHLAIEGNHLQIVQYLLQTFAEELDFTVRNEDGLIPLDLAIKKKYSYITNAILSDKRAWIFAFRSSLISSEATRFERSENRVRLRVY